MQKVRESFNLDKPVIGQYSAFLVNIIKGDFGVSYNYRKPVIDVIMDYLPFYSLFCPDSSFCATGVWVFTFVYFHKKDK